MPHNPDHCTPLKYQYVSNVTLACEDIEHFEEHKVMLAVWDSIFQNWENTRHPLARHHLSQKPVNFYSEHSLEEFSKVWRWTARLRRRLRWSSWITSNQLGSTDNLARKCGVVLAGRATTQTIARRHIMRSSTGHCLFVFDRLILLDVSFYHLVNNCYRQVGRCGTSQPPQSYPCDRGGTQHGWKHGDAGANGPVGKTTNQHNLQDSPGTFRASSEALRWRYI